MYSIITILRVDNDDPEANNAHQLYIEDIFEAENFYKTFIDKAIKYFTTLNIKYEVSYENEYIWQAKYKNKMVHIKIGQYITGDFEKAKQYQFSLDDVEFFLM